MKFMEHQAQVYDSQFDNERGVFVLTGPRQSSGKTEAGLWVALSAAYTGDRVGYLCGGNDLAVNNTDRLLALAHGHALSIERTSKAHGQQEIRFKSGGVVRFWSKSGRVPAYGKGCRWILDDVEFSRTEWQTLALPLSLVAGQNPLLYLGQSSRLQLKPFGVNRRWNFGIEEGESISDVRVWRRVHGPGIAAGLIDIRTIEEMYYAMDAETFRREVLNGY